MLRRDQSAIGTVIGLTVLVLAVGGSVLFDWQWGATGQPVPMVLGLIAAGVAVVVTIRLVRS